MNTPKYRTPNVQPSAIAYNLRQYGYTCNGRDIVIHATKMGIASHPAFSDNRPTYRADQAKRIFEDYAGTNTPTPTNLSGYSDTDLVAELRRRGWEVKATKTTITEL